MLQIKFKVHNITNSTEKASAVVNGETIQATIDALEVELVSDHYGSLILKFVGSEVAEAKNLFVKDATKVWTV